MTPQIFICTFEKEKKRSDLKKKHYNFYKGSKCLKCKILLAMTDDGPSIYLYFWEREHTIWTCYLTWKRNIITFAKEITVWSLRYCRLLHPNLQTTCLIIFIMYLAWGILSSLKISVLHSKHRNHQFNARLKHSSHMKLVTGWVYVPNLNYSW